MVNAAKELQDIRAAAERKPEIVVELAKPLIASGAISSLGPDTWLIYEQVAIAALDIGDDPLSERCIHELQKQFPGSARVDRLEGMKFEAQERFQEALGCYEKILTKDETNVLASKRKVMVLRAMGQPSKAIESLVKYLDTNYTDFEGWIQLADLYLEFSKYDQAAFCMEESLMLQPQNHIFHLKYAEILYTQNKISLALKEFCRVVELCKDHLRGLYGIKLCTARILSGRIDDSEDNDTSNDRIKALDLLASEQLLAIYAKSGVARTAQVANTKWIEQL